MDKLAEFLKKDTEFSVSEVLKVMTVGNIIMTLVMPPLRRHIFVCFMAKSAFGFFSALSP